MDGHWRGHATVWDETARAWRYKDTRDRVGGYSGGVDRPCAYCRRPATPEGYDGCIGEIEGASAACCGHGVPSRMSVVFPDGAPILGSRARIFIEPAMRRTLARERSVGTRPQRILEAIRRVLGVDEF